MSTAAVSRYDRNGPLVLLGVLVLAGVLLWAIYAGAWLADDAYITFRTVDNWVNGHGLRWNVAERVQTYTHPLWMMLNAAAYYVTREMFYTGLCVAMGVSFTAVALLVFGVARYGINALLVLLLLLLSRAFLEYSTSGLENPLTHLLLALFAIAFLRPQWRSRTVFIIAFLASLLMLNRIDTLLLVFPALLMVWLSERTLRCTLLMAAGFLPLLAWELFSLLYYGFPFPNTAYAKLGTGIDSGVMFQQGLYYLLDSITVDPATLLAIAAAAIAACMLKQGQLVMLALGMLLYVLYVVKVGGDFMSGRFLSPPFFVAMILLARVPVSSFRAGWAVLLLLTVTLVAARGAAPFYTSRDFGRDTTGFIGPHGVGDERRFYFTTSSLRHTRPGREMPAHGWANSGRDYRKAGIPQVRIHGAVGFRGFLAGPDLHIVDYHALGDPLLARLPAMYRPGWRIGHFARHVPEGYVETLKSGENQIKDPRLAEYYDHLARITRAPLFDRERLRDILKMNLGLYDHLIEWDTYRYPPLRQLRLSEVTQVKEKGSPWNGPGNIVIEPPHKGFEINLEQMRHAPGLELSLDWNDPYMLLFLREGRVLAEIPVGPPPARQRGLAVYQVRVPEAAWREGYDTLRLVMTGRDPLGSLGHLRLIE